MDSAQATIKDHETRIRVSEKLSYRVLAFAAVGSFLGSLLAVFILI